MADYIPLPEAIDRLPVAQGDTLWLTADLTRLAMMVQRKEGHFHPDMLIDLLQNRLGGEGTIVVPAFNHNIPNGGRFSIKETRPSTGALAGSLIARKDFRRTAHPLHSFLVWGKYSDDLMRLSNISSFGPDSPFGLLCRIGAKTLMIGTSVSKAFTFTHYVEESCNVGYRSYRTRKITCTDENGATVARTYKIFAKKPGWDMCLERLEKLLDERGLIFSARWGGIPCYVIKLDETYDVIRDDIVNNRARNIACFSFELYLRQRMKTILRSLIGYRTAGERASG